MRLGSLAVAGLLHCLHFHARVITALRHRSAAGPTVAAGWEVGGMHYMQVCAGSAGCSESHQLRGLRRGLQGRPCGEELCCRNTSLRTVAFFVSAHACAVGPTTQHCQQASTNIGSAVHHDLGQCNYSCNCAIMVSGVFCKVSTVTGLLSPQVRYLIRAPFGNMHRCQGRRVGPCYTVAPIAPREVVGTKRGGVVGASPVTANGPAFCHIHSMKAAV